MTRRSHRRGSRVRPSPHSASSAVVPTGGSTSKDDPSARPGLYSALPPGSGDRASTRPPWQLDVGMPRGAAAALLLMLRRPYLLRPSTCALPSSQTPTTARSVKVRSRSRERPGGCAPPAPCAVDLNGQANASPWAAPRWPRAPRRAPAATAAGRPSRRRAAAEAAWAIRAPITARVVRVLRGHPRAAWSLPVLVSRASSRALPRDPRAELNRTARKRCKSGGSGSRARSATSRPLARAPPPLAPLAAMPICAWQPAWWQAARLATHLPRARLPRARLPRGPPPQARPAPLAAQRGCVRCSSLKPQP